MTQMAAEEVGMSSVQAPSGVMQLSPVRGGGGSSQGPPVGNTNGGNSGEGRSSSGTHNVAKQLNKLKSFLGTLQSYRDPSEDDLTVINRRRRIDVAIDSLVVRL